MSYPLRAAARTSLALLLFCVFPLDAFASQEAARAAMGSPDPIIGTWKLNVERSVYSPGPRPPADLVTLREYALLPGGWIRFTNSSVDARGAPAFGIGVFKVDGQRHPAHNIESLGVLMTTGRASNLTRSYRRIDERTVEFITYTDAAAGIPSIRAVTADGRSFTETIRGINGQGVSVSNVLVWDRVEP